MTFDYFEISEVVDNIVRNILWKFLFPEKKSSYRKKFFQICNFRRGPITAENGHIGWLVEIFRKNFSCSKSLRMVQFVKITDFEIFNFHFLHNGHQASRLRWFFRFFLVQITQNGPIRENEWFLAIFISFLKSDGQASRIFANIFEIFFCFKSLRMVQFVKINGWNRNLGPFSEIFECHCPYSG